MPKTEVLATSFILTLTIISTVPVRSANLQCNLVFFTRKNLSVVNKKISYDLAKIKITEFNKYKDYLNRENKYFNINNPLNRFFQKINQEIGDFNSFNLRSSYWQETSFTNTNQLTVLTELKTDLKSAFSFTQLPFSDKLTPKLTFTEINTKTFSSKTGTQKTIGSNFMYPETRTLTLNSTDTSNSESEIKIGSESLPMISLIVSSLVCLVSPKKSSRS